MTTTKTAAKTAAVLALAFLSLPGCKKDGGAGASGTGSAVAAGEPGTAQAGASQQEADAQLGEKLGEYIGCFNGVTGSVHHSWDRYLDWVDEKKGPTGKERNVYGLFQINGTDTCAKAIDKAKGLPPSLPDVEAAAEAYKAAANDLVPLVQTAYKYYDQKDYQDDAFAKAKEMHVPLLEAFKRFFDADKALDARVITLKDALDERRLKALEADPNRKLQYLVEKSIASAKKLLEGARVIKLDDLDETKFQTALTTFDTDVTNLETFAAANKAETDKVTSLDSVVRYEQELVKAAKALVRRKREKKDFNKEFFSNSSPQLVEGHPAQVLDKYNQLIRQTNFIRFRG